MVRSQSAIAPRAGAWIEIHKDDIHLLLYSSHLVQVRGLKSGQCRGTGDLVQSHLVQVRGLKSFIRCLDRVGRTSHLVQVRGLKFPKRDDVATVELSHLVQVRGLKSVKP